MRIVRSLLIFAVLGLAASMKCKTDSKGLRVDFSKESGANYYEVQVSHSSTGPAIAAEATEAASGAYVHIYGAIKGKTYYVRLRHHSGSALTGHWRLERGWSGFGKWYECEYKKSAEDVNVGNDILASEQTATLGQLLVERDELHSTYRNTTSKGQKVETFNLGVVRQAKFGWPDYLDEKNAAGYGCDASYAHAGGLMQLFCVEVMKVTFDKSKIFSYDDKHFSHYANYLSCNIQAQDYQCTPMVGGDCSWFHMTGQGSRCQQIAANTEHSRLHVGKGERCCWDNHFSAYSFPAKTECREHEHVGTKRNGVTCTWKRHNHFRLTTMQAGWDSKALEDALHTKHLDHWKCMTSLNDQELLRKKDVFV